MHLETFPETPASWGDDALVEKWNRIRTLRRVVTGALEVARRDKVIGASLEAAPLLYLDDQADRAILDGLDLAEIANHLGRASGRGRGPRKTPSVCRTCPASRSASSMPAATNARAAG